MRRHRRARTHFELQFVRDVRAPFPGPAVQLQTRFSLREIIDYRHSWIQSRIIWRRRRAHNHFELQFVADVRALFAGLYLFNIRLVFLLEKRLTLDIQKFKVEKFDDATRSQTFWIAVCGRPRSLHWTLPVQIQTHFSPREASNYGHS